MPSLIRSAAGVIALALLSACVEPTPTPAPSVRDDERLPPAQPLPPPAAGPGSGAAERPGNPTAPPAHDSVDTGSTSGAGMDGEASPRPDAAGAGSNGRDGR